MFSLRPGSSNAHMFKAVRGSGTVVAVKEIGRGLVEFSLLTKAGGDVAFEVKF
ncbi:hypothetical protein SCARR_00917 [Pontiella sulfatireligans]|uniref:Uncharacterized protein n=1 Tax=Pontiella sulfatireligans TaxID=2750658 RepID=A0A6C2UHN0_9BACT|nr:hypothetical protein SCARR_00917 [Pontiella sulfatireligans]